MSKTKEKINFLLTFCLKSKIFLISLWKSIMSVGSVEPTKLQRDSQILRSNFHLILLS